MHKTLVLASTLVALGAAPLLAQTKPVTGQAPAAAPAARGDIVRAAVMGSQDLSALREARIAIVKGALQLRPDQQQYWPAVEAAIRGRSEAREKRIKQIQARLDDSSAAFDPVQMLKNRSDALAQRAESLRKLADAWQPLYTTLDADQKRRMVIVTALALREARNAIDARMTDDDEEMEDF